MLWMPCANPDASGLGLLTSSLRKQRFSGMPDPIDAWIVVCLLSSSDYVRPPPVLRRQPSAI